jgi:hypothetical protein
MIAFVIVISCLSLGFAVFLARQVIAKDTGTPKMREISDAIKEGAEAFMSRQNRTIISLSAVLALLIFVLYGFVRAPSKADPVPPVELAFGLPSRSFSARLVRWLRAMSACGCRSAPISAPPRRCARA